jgi:thioredoxin 1
MIKEIGDLNFSDEVEKESGVTVIDFWASWCGPCRMIGPIVEELSEELGEKVKFAKVNVDDNPNVSQKYRIASIPTIMVFKGGNVVETIVGFRPKQDLKSTIERHI